MIIIDIMFYFSGMVIEVTKMRGLKVESMPTNCGLVYLHSFWWEVQCKYWYVVFETVVLHLKLGSLRDVPGKSFQGFVEFY